MNAVQKAIARGVLREARALSRSGGSLRLVDPPAFSWLVKQHGTGAFAAPPSPAQLQALLFPGAPFAAAGLPACAELRARDIVALLRACFRDPAAGQTLDAGLRHLSSLTRLRARAPLHSAARTHAPGGAACVEVEVATRALFSAPADLAQLAEHFRHAYRVRLRNAGAAPVQLLTRHLVFTDARQGSIVVPYGSPGVVGAAPTLAPGQVFEYVSSVALSTPGGVMRGSYGFVAEDGGAFDAELGAVELRPLEGDA
jgi:ApaG protein